MPNYRKTKSDANQSEIVAHLRAHRVFVEVVSAAGRVTDSITNSAGGVGFLEYKIEGSKAVYTRCQLEFIAHTPFSIGIVTTKEAALQFALDPKRCGLTQKQKDGLAGLLLRNPGKKRFTPNEVNAAIKL